MENKSDAVVPDDPVAQAYYRYLLAVQAYRERHKLPLYHPQPVGGERKRVTK
ncbi:hypothetical protein GTP45_02510 [Pseudoduganella sp. FT55W]|uniref:Uncharacterized protein n=1 Tax=Duganella rivi TaxID=2666083 RepID=A0A7X4GME3_9BURK|nr:hypothetical protein [Duganella rivi]MYM65705.1 hypothetical protein [Duganella rivi]